MDFIEITKIKRRCTPLEYRRAAKAAALVVGEAWHPYQASEHYAARQGLTESIADVWKTDEFAEWQCSATDGPGA